ncbi:MAG: hypothetical protein WCT04_24400 [Planctomycetota bacterium]
MENAVSPQNIPTPPSAPKTKKKKRPERTIVEDFEALAKKGDFEGLIDGYVSDLGYRLTSKQKSELIRRAMKAHAHRWNSYA